jgi:LPXTG-motif cell wall-anchored protein
LIDPDLTNNTATDRDVMWKEWLKNPPKKKTKGVKIIKNEPSLGGEVIETIDAVLAFTGSDAQSLALTGLFVGLSGIGLVGLGKRRRRTKARPTA